MKTFLAIVFLVLMFLAGAGVAQHRHYMKARRDAVADRQDPFHAASAFHVATLVRLAPGQKLLPGVRSLVEATEGEGGYVVYAGKIVGVALQSSQLPEVAWDAFVLAQYPSREVYDAAAASPGLEKARAAFADSYAQGLQRSRALNLAIPIGLLGLRAVDVVRRPPERYPFQPGDLSELPPEAREQRERMVKALEANREYGRDALVVLNFIQAGTPEQQAADRAYGFEMLSLMAKRGYGPMHMGRAVTLEGDARFDNVAIVYYPGVDYFADMIQSEFFLGIVGNKQLGDSLAAPSVPLLPHL